MILFINIITVVLNTIVYTTGKYKAFVDLDKFETVKKQMDEILLTCSSEKKLDTIGVLRVSENLIDWKTDRLMKSFAFQQMEGKASNESKTLLLPSAYDHHRLSPKLQIIILLASSARDLSNLLLALKKSPWWNPSALYFILDVNITKNGCKNARNFLEITWTMEILWSVFVCSRSNEELTIYAYNPFRNWAPAPWQRDSGNARERDDDWTLFRRNYIRDRTTCNDLDFDKTSSLGGWKIRTVAFSIPPLLTINYNETGRKMFGGFDGSIMNILWTKLNSSLLVTLVNDTKQNYSYVNEDGRLHGILSDMHLEDYDIIINSQYIFNKPHLTFTYPHVNAAISVLTKFTGFETKITKIFKFMNLKVIIGVILVSLLTIVVLGVLAGRGLIVATLEILRMITGVSMDHPPRRYSLRIYVITVVLVLLITGSAFQSCLSSTLTWPMAKPNVNGLDDLEKFNYKIYTFYEYKNAFIDTTVQSRVIVVYNWNCSEYVLREENSACAADQASLLKIAFENDLHISKNSIYTPYAAYAVRPDWPLRKRLSTLLLWLQEAGLTHYWGGKMIMVYKQKWLMKLNSRVSGSYRAIMIKDLKYAFVMLITGFSCATIAFLVELAFARSKKRKVVVTCSNQPNPIY